MAGVTTSRWKHLRSWPLHRYLLWCAGIGCGAAPHIGPLAVYAQHHFIFHMANHLLLGMLAPLLLVLGAPITLVFRTLPVIYARKLSFILKLWPFRLATHPLIASVLNIGGLWVLYSTDLYPLMHEYQWLFVLVHLHIFLAGLIFTLSMIYIDPVFHRYSYMYRAVVFVAALAGHGILSKFLYAYPPPGVSREEAEIGGMLMYYGGDMIDLVLILVFCQQWYKSVKTVTKKVPVTDF
ncbi:cytochrome c oxidase assembly protein [Fictibacillus sp. NRS-1165]|uniref:cytochrome c oxidase assembly protein n=1 Tax=Fictibacillus sp. NRS-1165 TaxID=3144463 RepID=UPI003D1D0B8E